MQVKIRLNYAARVRSARGWDRQAALIGATLLTPVSLMALSLGLWRVAADLGWAQSFAIADGLFSRWQIWMAVAILAQAFGLLLQRYSTAAPPPAE